MFSGKESNSDAITTAMQLIAYSILYENYFNLSKVIMTEIGAKLGKIDSRTNKIYFARFIMLCINHLVEEVILDRAEYHLPCWTQSKSSVHGPGEDK